MGVALLRLARDLSLRARWGEARARTAHGDGRPRAGGTAAVEGHAICALCEMVANGLRCGQGLLQSLSVAAGEVEGPLGEAIGNALKQFAAGVPLSQALRAAEQGLRNRDFGQVVRAIEVFQETGGDVSEALAQVAKAARERDDMRATLSSRTADAQVSAVIVAVMPFVLGTLSYISQPAVFHAAARTVEGRCAFVLGLALWGTGACLAWRTTHPEWL